MENTQLKSLPSNMDDNNTEIKPKDNHTEIKPLPHSLYVGDLDASVTENQLVDIFSKFGELESATLCQDTLTLQSLCYGFVNFKRLEDAKRAMESLNYSVLNEKSIRIMWQQPNSETIKSGVGNIFVKNLDGSIDNQKLNKIFSKFGCILSCKVALFEDGKSKGYGFVQYEEEESAKNAIEQLNGILVENKALYVANFIKKSDRIAASFTNLYVKNLGLNMTEECLREKFHKFGNITSTVISKDANGVSRGFGFVNFEKPEDAKRAKEAMHGTQLGSKVLYVARAQKLAERKAMLSMRQQRIKMMKGRNLYIKNINEDVNEDNLKAYFSQFGSIDSVKIMQTMRGVSKGFGFVLFSKPEEAMRAINARNGVIFHGKPLYVALAQTKAERKAFLQNIYNYGRPLTYTLPNFPNFYHSHRDMPSMVPGWRPPFQSPLPPLPRIQVPSDSTRSNRVWMGNQLNNYSIPSMSNTPFIQYPNQHKTIKRVNGISNGQHRDSENLSSILAAATPDQRKVMLRDRLYPLVKKLKRNHSSDIVELLLQMEDTELLVLLDSPESLATKVEEALSVIEDRNGSNCA